MKTAFLITARLKSTWLPKKILLEVAGKPLIVYMLGRTKHATTINQNLLLCTDDNNSYKKYYKVHNIKHKALNLSKKHRVAEKYLNLQNVNATHSRLKGWMSRFHGVASKYLQNYMNYFRTLEEIKKSENACCDFLHYALLADCSFTSKKNISQHLAKT